MPKPKYYILQGGRGQVNHAGIRGTRTTVCGLGPPYALQKRPSLTKVTCRECKSALRGGS